jgi:hypothetical protein
MDEKIHNKFVRFVQKTKRRSLSAFFAELGEAEIKRHKEEEKARQKQKDLCDKMGRIK